jgi:hypothetical protein
MKCHAKRPLSSLMWMLVLAAGAVRLAADDFGQPASSDELKSYCVVAPVAPLPFFNFNVTCDPRWYQGESAVAADVHRTRLVGAQNDLYFGPGGCNKNAALGALGDCGVSAAVNFLAIPKPSPWSRWKLTRTWGDPNNNYQQYTFLTGFDPSTAVDSQYRYYVAYGVADLDKTLTDGDERNFKQPPNVPNAVVVTSCISCTGGDKWVKTNAVAYDPGPAGMAKYFHDKFWIAIDTLVNKDQIYVTWTRNDLVKGGQDIVASYSTDLGKTWNGPNIVNTNNTSRLVIGAFPAVAPDGTVYIVWDDYKFQSLYINKSQDGGKTWKDPVLITPTWSDAPGGLGIDIGCNSGRTMTAMPAMVVDKAGNIFVVFASQVIPGGGGNFHVWATKSTDGGTTWTPASRVSTPKTDNHQYNPSISIDSNSLLNVSYLDRRDDPGNCLTREYLSRSLLPSDIGAFADFQIGNAPSDFDVGMIVNNNSNGPGDYTGVASISGFTFPYFPDLRLLDATGGSVAGEIYTAAKQ